MHTHISMKSFMEFFFLFLFNKLNIALTYVISDKNLELLQFGENLDALAESH